MTDRSCSLRPVFIEIVSLNIRISPSSLIFVYCDVDPADVNLTKLMQTCITFCNHLAQAVLNWYPYIPRSCKETIRFDICWFICSRYNVVCRQFITLRLMGERKIPFKSKVVYYMDIDEIPVFCVHKISFFFSSRRCKCRHG